jgi:hypothetical protein
MVSLMIQLKRIKQLHANHVNRQYITVCRATPPYIVPSVQMLIIMMDIPTYAFPVLQVALPVRIPLTAHYARRVTTLLQHSVAISVPTFVLLVKEVQPIV